MRETPAFNEREYLSSGVNMLTSSVKISDTTKKTFFELILFQTDQKISEKYCRADSCIVSDRLISWLSISVLTRSFLGIKVNPLFAVYNFRNKKLLRLIFLLKVFQILCRFRICRYAGKNTANIFGFRDNTTWIDCFKHSLLLKQNTCHWVSIC